jgi:hypothetical protein
LNILPINKVIKLNKAEIFFFLLLRAVAFLHRAQLLVFLSIFSGLQKNAILFSLSVLRIFSLCREAHQLFPDCPAAKALLPEGLSTH